MDYCKKLSSSSQIKMHCIYLEKKNTVFSFIASYQMSHLKAFLSRIGGCYN